MLLLQRGGFLLQLFPPGQQKVGNVLVHQEGDHTGGHHPGQTRLEALIEASDALEPGMENQRHGWVSESGPGPNNYLQ